MKRALEAVQSRQIMSTNIFELSAAEKAGLVTRKLVCGYNQWALTPNGIAALEEVQPQ